MNHKDCARRNTKIVACLARGMTGPEVGVLFGLKPSAINTIGRNAGLKRAGFRPGHSVAFIEDARALWGRGFSASEIAAKMGKKYGRFISRNAIVGIADRNDFPARPSPIKRKAA